MDAKAFWVGFNLVKGIGAVRLRLLLEHFGSLEVAWQAPADVLAKIGLPQKSIEHLQRIRRDVNLEQVWARIEAQGISVLTWEDESYPRRLKEIDQAPPVLYYRGELLNEDEFAVAVVGTRRVTLYGRQVVEELSAFLAQNGLTVVSGLARGVDALAHDAVLKAGGRTLAVLGSGVDRIYPPEHRGLAKRIMAQGAIISDYAPRTPPDGINFPPRNRIISGLTLATVVVEAGETSGALITASFAANQGREVLAVPGNINAPQSKGCNMLIQQGARPYLRPEDILDVLKMEQIQEKREACHILPTDAIEASLLQVIGLEPQHIDEIRSQTGLPIEQVSATLTLMELKGMIRQVGGMNYVAVRENFARYREK